jgi:EAL and modified HD-GYP domain-containing signal transduction protein
MEEVLKSLPLANDISKALLNKEGEVGELLRLILSYERGSWQEVSGSEIPVNELSSCYLESMAWAKELM